ncbi:MAG: hypothetical protein JWR38_3748 [Mucilaginibacter sp.]|nr:hypothetical protein [Mucilaginibacter sp.]
MVLNQKTSVFIDLDQKTEIEIIKNHIFWPKQSKFDLNTNMNSKLTDVIKHHISVNFYAYFKG